MVLPESTSDSADPTPAPRDDDNILDTIVTTSQHSNPQRPTTEPARAVSPVGSFATAGDFTLPEMQQRLNGAAVLLNTAAGTFNSKLSNATQSLVKETEEFGEAISDHAYDSITEYDMITVLERDFNFIERCTRYLNNTSTDNSAEVQVQRRRIKSHIDKISDNVNNEIKILEPNPKIKYTLGMVLGSIVGTIIFVLAIVLYFLMTCYYRCPFFCICAISIR